MNREVDPSGTWSDANGGQGPDFIGTLLDDLRSPDASLRFSVLERIDGIDWTPDRLDALTRHLADERDPGTRFALEKVVARVRPSPSSEPDAGDDAGPGRIAILTALLADPARNDLSIALLLDALSPAEARLAIDLLEDRAWTELPPRLLPTVLRLFRRYGTPADARGMEQLCRHPDPWVLAAAVETLAVLDPDSLQPLIRPLLDNPNPGIRSRAIRLLHRLDPAEALDQFAQSLGSDDPDDREAALFQAVFLPFSDLEPHLLRFLSVEPLPRLIRKAGLLFQANPSPGQPLPLLELQLACRGERRSLIESILHGVLTALFQTGMVTTPPGEFHAELLAMARRRRATVAGDMLQIALKSGEPTTRRTAILRLGTFAGSEFADLGSRLLAAHRERESDAALLGLIDETLAAFGPPPAPVAAPAATAPVPAAVPAIPARIDAGSYAALRPALPGLLTCPDPAGRLRLLRAVGAFGSHDDAIRLGPALHDPEPTCIAAAVETLQQLAPEALAGHLRRLLGHAAPEVRAAAIRALSLFDKRQALELVGRLLLAPDPRWRDLGVFYAAQFDFPAVEPLLVRALAHETDPGRIGQLCAIVAPNLTPGLRERLAALSNRDGDDDPVRREHLTRLLGAPTPTGNRASLAEALRRGGFLQLPLSEQRRLLETIDDRPAFATVAPALRNLASAHLPRATLLQLLRLVTRFGERADGDLPGSLLDHADPAVVGAAINALGTVDPDRVIPFFGRFLTSEDPRIRSAVIQTFLRFDRAGAVQQMRAMSESPRTGLRRNFLALLPQFEFREVFEPLLRLFERERDPEVKSLAGTLLATNPCREGLQALYVASHDADGQLLTAMADLWRGALDAASLVLGGQPDDLEHECAKAKVAAAAGSAALATGARPQGLGGMVPAGATDRMTDGKPTAPPAATSPAPPSPTPHAAASDARLRGIIALTVMFALIAFGVALKWSRSRSGAADSRDQVPATRLRFSRDGPAPVIAIEGRIDWIDHSTDRRGILVSHPGPPSSRLFVRIPASAPVPGRVGSTFRGRIRPHGRDGATILADLVPDG